MIEKTISLADIISLLLSVAALVVSGLTAWLSDRANRASIHADNCSKIFDEYLIERIPKSRAGLRFDGKGKLHNGNELCDAISSMAVSALFYKYDDEEFYRKLSGKCTSLEDIVAEAGNYIKPSEHDQRAFFREVQASLQEIYSLIDRKRLGRN